MKNVGVFWEIQLCEGDAWSSAVVAVPSPPSYPKALFRAIKIN